MVVLPLPTLFSVLPKVKLYLRASCFIVGFQDGRRLKFRRLVMYATYDDHQLISFYNYPASLVLSDSVPVV